jgi:nitrogen fixation-related uncharacterized protein
VGDVLVIVVPVSVALAAVSAWGIWLRRRRR